MQTFYCPKCDASLSASIPAGVTKVNLRCAKCGYVGDLATFSKCPKTNDSSTNVNAKTAGPHGFFKPATLQMIKDDGNWIAGNPATIPLKRGINTIGRKSENSQSNTQLPTTDAFMSKNHAAIEVVYKEKTSIFEHTLSDCHSKNRTFHNGKPLEADDSILLCIDDEIRIGHTVLKIIIE